MNDTRRQWDLVNVPSKLCGRARDKKALQQFPTDVQTLTDR